MKIEKIEAEVSSPDCDNHVWLHLHSGGRHMSINLGDAENERARDILALAGLHSASPPPGACLDAEDAQEPDVKV